MSYTYYISFSVLLIKNSLIFVLFLIPVVYFCTVWILCSFDKPVQFWLVYRWTECKQKQIESVIVTYFFLPRLAIPWLTACEHLFLLLLLISPLSPVFCSQQATEDVPTTPHFPPVSGKLANDTTILNNIRLQSDFFLLSRK